MCEWWGIKTEEWESGGKQRKDRIARVFDRWEWERKAEVRALFSIICFSCSFFVLPARRHFCHLCATSNSVSVRRKIME